MSETRSAGTTDVRRAVDSLVERGVLTPAQAAAVLAELQIAPGGGAEQALPPTERRRRTLSEVLVEAGLYVGSALVIAAGFVMAAQSWGSMSLGTQVAVLAAVAIVSGALGLVIGHGADPGTARRRLAGVLLTGTAASAAGTTAVLLTDAPKVGTVALAVGLLVMIGAQWAARSAVTELATFAAGAMLVTVAIEEFRPASAVTLDEWGYEVTEASTYDRLMPLALVGYGLAWALAISRRLMHRELGVFLGMFTALVAALPVIGDPEYRGAGMAVMLGLAALGFWRFMVEGYWPWLAGAIAGVTAVVFWAVGGGSRPAVAVLVAGLVLLGGSGLGWQLARRRRLRGAAPPG